MSNSTFETYLEMTRTIADIESATAVLSWDQETNMPPGGAMGRAEQLASLSALAHQKMVDNSYVSLVEELSQTSDLEEWQKGAVRESLRNVRQATRLPEEHVREMAKATSYAHHAWKEARSRSDFSLFAESLTRLVELKRREAGYLGYDENPYDALIDLYEPGMTVAQIRPVFDRLREGTKELLELVASAGSEPDDTILYRNYAPDRQLAYATRIVGELGYDRERGRVDLSAHPFCTSFGTGDVRLTTRIFENDLRSCLFGLIHEAGHGMYEQGFDERFARTPLANGTSMGIHESQSLFWENMIARSEPFWRWAYPSLQETFPESLAGIDAFAFYRAINIVKPSLIRIEADELTYNLHILLRWEIEEGLINGTVEVAEIPSIWNGKMEDYLGILPPNDAEGALQDIHWSFGGFGYFPSYTLGKLYAAMFHRQMAKDLPDMEEMIARGEFTPILGWLREKIHHWGKLRRADELVQSVCGEPLSEKAFLDHNRGKIERVYGIGATAG